MRTLGLLMALALVGCELERPGHEQRPAPAAASPATSHATLESTPQVRGPSIYELNAELRDESGGTIGLSVFRGRPVIISMFYGSCAYACPTLISDVKRLEKQLDPAVRREVRVLLISFDTERDTPARLRELSELHAVDAARWKLVSAQESDARSIAAVLGIKYRRLENGEFNHSSVITVLDRKGSISASVDGLRQPLDALAESLRGAAATPAM